MAQAYIIKEEEAYAMCVTLVFASSENEAKTLLGGSTHSLHTPNPTILLKVDAPYQGEAVVPLGGYSE